MKDYQPLVSIILPVYNGEKYLAAAIDSVLSQTCPEWELIIIDDGSKDGSASICDDYSGKDARITVFHQQNAGVNTARAKGVDNAKGDYLIFLDADDSLSEDALAYMLDSVTDEDDLLVCGKDGQCLNNEDYLKQLWAGTIPPALWGKMFRALKYKQMDYAIDQRRVMGEDLLLNSMYALECRRVKVLPREVYMVNYHNESSVTRTFKHNWDYEKFYFSNVRELFLDKCTSLNSYEQINMLVNKSWLNAMKYVMLDGGSIDYKDAQFQEVKDFFEAKRNQLGPSEKLIFTIRNSALYRLVLNTYLKHRKNNK